MKDYAKQELLDHANFLADVAFAYWSEVKQPNKDIEKKIMYLLKAEKVLVDIANGSPKK